MSVLVIAFGSLTDIVGESLSFEDVPDTDALVAELYDRFPQLKVSSYLLAVNRKMINSNTELHTNDTVALMSPFSGG